jgi:hypothetical protein
MISLWNIEHAARELERCRKAGLRGATIALRYSSTSRWTGAAIWQVTSKWVRSDGFQVALRSVH